MCGIFFYSGKYEHFFPKLQTRGPDGSQFLVLRENISMGFHRLAINGLGIQGMQPFQKKDDLYMVCNGEIYNYSDLAMKYDIPLHTGSDCEIILPLYEKIGIHALCRELQGEFAFVIYDKGNVYGGRDPLGIRSLYYAFDGEETILCSEMKAIPHEIQHVQQFPCGSYLENKKIHAYISWYNPVIQYHFTRDDWILRIRTSLLEVCQRRLMSERNIGCILSGGLDSSIITSIVCRLLRQIDPMRCIRTYTIGMQGGTDLYYANVGAKYLQTDHYEFIVDQQDFLNMIESTIYQIESYDVTTVRASIGNYLLCQKIKEVGKDVVIFCGDVADELFGSYRGFQNAPTDDAFLQANVNMLQNIQYFDVLRSDKSISGASLEARVPFGDAQFVDLCMSIPPSLKRFDGKNIEKALLREAFHDFLPEEILYRRKEAFSDGISSQQDSWFSILQRHIDQLCIPENYEEYPINTPYDKESLYYRQIFEKYYPNRANTIPYYWKHPFTTEKDPSARKLTNY